MTLVPVKPKRVFQDGVLFESELLPSNDDAELSAQASHRDLADTLQAIGYSVGDDDVCEFVTEAGLLDLLIETRTRLSDYFDEACRVDLDLIVDPEGGDWRFLVAIVRGGKDLDDIMDRFARYEDAWGLQANMQEPRLCVTVG